MEPETEASPETCSSLLTTNPKTDIKLDRGEQAAHSGPDSVTSELQHLVSKSQVRLTLSHEGKNYHEDNVFLNESHQVSA